MTKIEDFVQKIQDENIPISKLLRDAKLLANQLHQKDFLKWIDFELQGYDTAGGKPPEYRSVTGQMKAWSPDHGWVPVVHKSSEIERQLTTRNSTQSVRQIEELLSDKKSSSYEMPYPASVSNMILEGDLKTKLSMFIDRSALVGILEAVRNRLFDWATALQRVGIDGGQVALSNKEKTEVKEIETKFNIGNIENFNGNLGSDNQYIDKDNTILTPQESFWSKVFWYVVVALIVVVIGNVASALILKYWFLI